MKKPIKRTKQIGFVIEHESRGFLRFGSDKTPIQWGSLDFAEQISSKGDIPDVMDEIVKLSPKTNKNALKVRELHLAAK